MGASVLEHKATLHGVIHREGMGCGLESCSLSSQEGSRFPCDLACSTIMEAPCQ